MGGVDLGLIGGDGGWVDCSALTHDQPDYRQDNLVAHPPGHGRRLLLPAPATSRLPVASAANELDPSKSATLPETRAARSR